jgi:hypothetical protein
LTGKKHSGSDLGQALLLEGGWGVQMKGVCVCVCVCLWRLMSSGHLPSPQMALMARK